MSAEEPSSSCTNVRSTAINGITPTKIPPPVLPKTFRKRTSTPTKPLASPASQKESNSKVYICVTEDTESAISDRYRQMEIDLETTKQEKDELEQQMLRLKEELQECQKEMKKVYNKLDHYNAVSRSKKVQDRLKYWSQSRPSIPDLRIPMPHDELADPQEMIKQFIESERLYLNCLEAVDFHFLQPMKMFSIFKCDILSTQQFHALFLNSPQLLVIHRLFHQQLVHLRNLPKEARLEEFVILLERFTPSFSLYAGFQSEHYMVNLQRELGHYQSKPQFSQLLDDLNKKCEGKTLVDLLRTIAGRLSEYQTLLSGFLEERLKGTRGMKEGIIKRLEGVKRFLDNIHLEIQYEKDWWDCIVDKMKILNRVSPNSPIPMDIFHPASRLIKQGQVNIVVKGKELQRQLFLFTSHLAIVEKLADQKFHFPEVGAMKTLAGAVVFSTIDTAGQAIEPDFHSGLKEDMLGFRVNLSQDSFVVRVGKPSEKKSWIECLEKAVKAIQTSEAESDEVLEAVIPDEAPQIAAASLEKLFQQLTNPQIPYKEEFIEIFLNTFQCFTTPKNVLTALINCIRSPDKEKTTPSLQMNTNGIFMFNMEDGIETESSISASNSIQNISDYDSDCSLSDSPIMSRRETGSSSSSAPLSARRISKIRDSKIKEEETTGISGGGITTDSDSSPYTSGVPVADNINREVELGWNESIEMMNHRNGRTISPVMAAAAKKKGMDKSQYPISRNSNYSQGSCNAGQGSDEDFQTNEKHYSRSVDDLLLEDSLFKSVQDSLKANGQHDLTQSQTLEGFTLVNYTTPPKNMSASSLDTTTPRHEYCTANSSTVTMDRADQLTSSCSQDILESKLEDDDDDDDDCFSQELDEINYRNFNRRSRRSDTDTPSPSINSSRRLSTVSNNLSFSEPDLVVLAVRTDREALLDITTPITAKEEDELLTSLPPTIARKFVDAPVTPQHTKSEKQKTKRLAFINKKKKHNKEKERKSDPSTLPDRRHTLNPSSSLYFNSSNSVNKDSSHLSPSRGFTGLFKKRDKDGKKLKKSPSVLSDDCTDGPVPETPSRKRMGRSSSLAPSIERHVYMNIDELGRLRTKGHEDVSPTLQRRSSNRSGYKNFNLAEKVFLILGRWIENHFEDFQSDPEMMEILDNFLLSMQSCESTGELKLAEQLSTLVNIFKMKSPKDQNAFTEALAPTNDVLVASGGDLGKPSRVLGCKTIDLSRSSNFKDTGFIRFFAEQMTMFKYSCYLAITRRELLNCNWKKKERETLSPNVCKLIHQTNEMTSWICTEILQQDTPSSRAIVIEHFVAFAMICYKHRDMHCALSITLALNSAPVKRLTKTWDSVDKRVRQKFEKLKDISDPQEKCKKLREKIERITNDEAEKYSRIPSCLPYLGAYLDLIYTLDIGVKTYNGDGLVNFTKMTKLSSLIDTFLQYQRSPYTFDPKHEIISYIMSAKKLSDNELYDLSIFKEPSKQR